MTLARREMKLVKRETEPGSAPNRVRQFVGSNDTVDCYNTRIIADGIKLERYKRNSVVLLQHNMRSFPIGVGASRVENGEFIVDVDFAPADDPISGPEAEQALRWVDRGVMGMSIGFDVLEAVYVEERETGDAWRDLIYPPEDYTAVELFEVSIVSVPANPDALPVGRSAAAQKRFLTRVAGQAPAPAPVVEIAAATPPPPAPPAPETVLAPAPVMSPAELRSMVERITREEKQALVARRSGKTSRSRP